MITGLSLKWKPAARFPNFFKLLDFDSNAQSAALLRWTGPVRVRSSSLDLDRKRPDESNSGFSLSSRKGRLSHASAEMKEHVNRIYQVSTVLIPGKAHHLARLKTLTSFLPLTVPRFITRSSKRLWFARFKEHKINELLQTTGPPSVRFKQRMYVVNLCFDAHLLIIGIDHSCAKFILLNFHQLKPEDLFNNLTVEILRVGTAYTVVVRNRRNKTLKGIIEGGRWSCEVLWPVQRFHCSFVYRNQFEKKTFAQSK